MCQALEVSRSGYYSWIKNGKKANFKFDENLLKAIEEIFYNKRTKYGYRRIHVEYNVKEEFISI